MALPFIEGALPSPRFAVPATHLSDDVTLLLTPRHTPPHPTTPHRIVMQARSGLIERAARAAAAASAGSSGGAAPRHYHVLVRSYLAPI